MDEVASHLLRALRVVVEGGDGRKDSGAGV